MAHRSPFQDYHREEMQRIGTGTGKGVRFGTLNVGSMTGKGREVAGMLRKRAVEVCCVQETRWKGGSARMIGEGYKLFYAGEASGRNGVGVIVSESVKDGVVEVKRQNSRMMVVRL